MAEITDRSIRNTIAGDFSRNFFVEASAGTGKTKCLVERIKNALIKEQVKPDSLAAITFTKKAADEMKTKVWKSIYSEQKLDKSKPPAVLKYVLDRINTINISTIHSFCLNILSERPLEAKLDINLELIEESDDFKNILW